MAKKISLQSLKDDATKFLTSMTKTTKKKTSTQKTRSTKKSTKKTTYKRKQHGGWGGAPSIKTRFEDE